MAALSGPHPVMELLEVLARSRQNQHRGSNRSGRTDTGATAASAGMTIALTGRAAFRPVA